jgi:hypothetical protein
MDLGGAPRARPAVAAAIPELPINDQHEQQIPANQYAWKEAD